MDVSIHAPREGCDGAVATEGWSVWVSIHAPREGCDVTERVYSYLLGVSIHAPREGCDYDLWCLGLFALGVSIHAPREGCDREPLSCASVILVFQFTHPGRGATPDHSYVLVGHSRFNSRTPGGVRQRATRQSSIMFQVSIHAPREGCDRWCLYASRSLRCFNSRTPGGVRLD